jgi:hypothetical protein
MNIPAPTAAPSCRFGKAESTSCYNAATFAIDFERSTFEPGSAPKCCIIVSDLNRPASQRKHLEA